MFDNYYRPAGEAEAYLGMNLYYRYQYGVDEEKGVIAELWQFCVIHQPKCYAWIAPAHWFNHITDTERAEKLAEQSYQGWKSKSRSGVKKVRKDALRSYAHADKKQAFEAFKYRQNYRLNRLNDQWEICKTLVDGLEKSTGPENEFVFGHNHITESYVWY